MCFRHLHTFSHFTDLKTCRNLLTHSQTETKAQCTKTLWGPLVLMLFTHDSWSHLTGPDNQSCHHTAERQGHSDPSHTGKNPDDTSATLEESQVVRSVLHDREYFKGTRRRAPPAHHSLVRLSYPRNRCHGHTPSSQGCTVRCHIETHSRSKASALSTTIHTRKRRNQNKVLLVMHTRHRVNIYKAYVFLKTA